jgi:hypothetical protein
VSVASEINHLRQDLDAILATLEQLPASSVLERTGFEAKRDEVRGTLSALESARASETRPAEPVGAAPERSEGSAKDHHRAR